MTTKASLIANGEVAVTAKYEVGSAGIRSAGYQAQRR
jgi:hypothetical protein